MQRRSFIIQRPSEFISSAFECRHTQTFLPQVLMQTVRRHLWRPALTGYQSAILHNLRSNDRGREQHRTANDLFGHNHDLRTDITPFTSPRPPKNGSKPRSARHGVVLVPTLQKSRNGNFTIFWASFGAARHGVANYNLLSSVWGSTVWHIFYHHIVT